MAISDQVKSMADKLETIYKKQTAAAETQAASSTKPKAPAPR